LSQDFNYFTDLIIRESFIVASTNGKLIVFDESDVREVLQKELILV